MDAGKKYKVSPSEDENDVLPNKLGLTVKEDVEKEEATGFIKASILLIRELTSDTKFTTKYILGIHKLALDHLYTFAGKLRTVNISKGGFSFPPAMHLENSMAAFQKEILDKLKNNPQNDADLIDDLARVHGELLFIHPFREGNGRTARLLANLMAFKAGRDLLSFERLDSEEMFAKYIHAVQRVGMKDYEPMKEIISYLL